MTAIDTTMSLNGIPLIRLESEHLRVDVAPGVGGRVVSVVHKASGHEFLWRNRGLELKRLAPGSEYDPNFFGGIDELLPNDMPEAIDSISCPDHGELWTTALDWKWEGERLKMHGTLPLFGLSYEREMSLRAEGPWLDCTYRITNQTRQTRHFLWKLHAALNVAPGDIVDCPARKGQVVDLAWSRYHTLAPFEWPLLEGQKTNIVPPADGTVDFFYLYELAEGRMAWQRPSAGLTFAYHFDLKFFPYSWFFASYGGFNGHYTIILEPCTTMPLSVNEAANKNPCASLAPGKTLQTHVSIYAGPIRAQQSTSL